MTRIVIMCRKSVVVPLLRYLGIHFRCVRKSLHSGPCSFRNCDVGR